MAYFFEQDLSFQTFFFFLIRIRTLNLKKTQTKHFFFDILLIFLSISTHLIIYVISNPIGIYLSSFPSFLFIIIPHFSFHKMLGKSEKKRENFNFTFGFGLIFSDQLVIDWFVFFFFFALCKCHLFFYFALYIQYLERINLLECKLSICKFFGFGGFRDEWRERQRERRDF